MTKWKSLSAFGDWHKTVPKGKVGLLVGYGGRLTNGRYPKKLKQILVPHSAGINGFFGKFELTSRQLKKYPKWKAKI